MTTVSRTSLPLNSSQTHHQLDLKVSLSLTSVSIDQESHKKEEAERFYEYLKGTDHTTKECIQLMKDIVKFIQHLKKFIQKDTKIQPARPNKTQDEDDVMLKRDIWGPIISTLPSGPLVSFAHMKL